MSESEKYYLDEHGGCAQCIRKKDRIAELEGALDMYKANTKLLAEKNAELKRENKYMRLFLERQSKGIPQNSATSILAALEDMK